MTSAERLACPESMSESIDTVLRSAEGQRAGRQKYDELLATFPQALQQQIMQGFTEPFDRETANALRSEFEKNRPAEQSRFAALVRLAATAGIAKLNGNEQKSYARTAWTETGLPQNPVSVQIGCPNCTKPALALVSLLEQRYGRREWHLKCPTAASRTFSRMCRNVGTEKPIGEGRSKLVCATGVAGRPLESARTMYCGSTGECAISNAFSEGAPGGLITAVQLAQCRRSRMALIIAYIVGEPAVACRCLSSNFARDTGARALKQTSSSTIFCVRRRRSRQLRSSTSHRTGAPPSRRAARDWKTLHRKAIPSRRPFRLRCSCRTAGNTG